MTGEQSQSAAAVFAPLQFHCTYNGGKKTKTQQLQRTPSLTVCLLSFKLKRLRSFVPSRLFTGNTTPSAQTHQRENIKRSTHKLSADTFKCSSDSSSAGSTPAARPLSSANLLTGALLFALSDTRSSSLPPLTPAAFSLSLALIFLHVCIPGRFWRLAAVPDLWRLVVGQETQWRTCTEPLFHC